MEKPFIIRFTTQVEFSDWNENILKVFEIGDTVTATADAGHYFITSWGGVYKEEAERVEETISERDDRLYKENQSMLMSHGIEPTIYGN